MSMSSRILVLACFATFAGCASGDDNNQSAQDSGGPADASHDTPLVDTSVPDSSHHESGSDADAVGETPLDSASDAIDAAGDSGADSESDSVADSRVDSGVDTGLDVADGVPDIGTDSLVDSIAETATETDGGPTAYRHTIAIDGVNDFTAVSESFATTSASYTAYVTWDDAALYIGYDGPDVSTTTASASSKWLFAYLDVDPGATTGATVGVKYNHQQPGFTAATGFGAEYYLRWKADGTYATLESYSAGAWATVQNYVPATRTWSTTGTGGTISSAQSGTYIEFRIPLNALGVSLIQVGVVTLWMNEAPGGEFTYAGLYSTTFAEGYYASPTTVPISAYLLADFSTTLSPNDSGRRRP